MRELTAHHVGGRLKVAPEHTDPHVLQVMKADIDTALGLTGQTAVADLDQSALYNAGAPVAER